MFVLGLMVLQKHVMLAPSLSSFPDVVKAYVSILSTCRGTIHVLCEALSNEAAAVHADIRADHRDVPAI